MTLVLAPDQSRLIKNRVRESPRLRFTKELHYLPQAVSGTSTCSGILCSMNMLFLLQKFNESDSKWSINRKSRWMRWQAPRHFDAKCKRFQRGNLKKPKILFICFIPGQGSLWCERDKYRLQSTNFTKFLKDILEGCPTELNWSYLIEQKKLYGQAWHSYSARL